MPIDPTTKLTDNQIATINKETDRIVAFCAEQIVEAIMETCTDDQLVNGQRIYDMVQDHMQGKDLTQMALSVLKERIGAK